jgi:hypothetical protein
VGEMKNPHVHFASIPQVLQIPPADLTSGIFTSQVGSSPHKWDLHLREREHAVVIVFWGFFFNYIFI